MVRFDPNVSSPIYRTLAWVGVVLQVMALIAAIATQRFNGVPSLAIFLTASLLCLMASSRLPSLITLILVAAAALNGAGWALNLYDRFAAFDELIHPISAFAGMTVLGYLAGAKGIIQAEPMSLEFITPLVAAGLALGVVWELMEMPFINLAWTDTLIDLLVDTVGAAVGAVVAGWTLLRSEGAKG